MTTTSPIPTEPRMWNPPCVVCSKPIESEAPEGRYRGVTRCSECSGVASMQRVLSSGIPRWFVENKGSLDTFKHRGNATLLHGVEKCRELLSQRSLLDRTWLVLTGGTGTGKSHLAAAVTQGFIAAGRTARFETFDAMLVAIQDSYDSNDADHDSTSEVIRRYTKDAYFLAIDDLGVEQPTAHAIQILYRIVNARLNDRLPLMITTNYPLTKKRDGQPTLGERLSERLSDDTSVHRILSRIAGEANHEHLEAPDYRRTKR